jgi:hypothetical protein
MEAEWIDEIIAHKAQVIRLTDDEGGPIHWAAALISGETSWRRALLDNLSTPLVIRINRAGAIIKITGEVALRERRDQLMTARIVRDKKSGTIKRPA